MMNRLHAGQADEFAGKAGDFEILPDRFSAADFGQKQRIVACQTLLEPLFLAVSGAADELGQSPIQQRDDAAEENEKRENSVHSATRSEGHHTTQKQIGRQTNASMF